jgi:polar amino acid transport system permease protein
MDNFGLKLENFWQIFYHEKAYEFVLTGLQNTLLIAVLGLVFGTLLGPLIAVVRVVPKHRRLPRILYGFCSFYVGMFSGTPIVVQLLLLHFGLFPLMGIDLDAVVEAIIIFGLNSGAYMSEILRGGINAVDAGQMEAGRSLGFGFGETMLRIILPQAIKNILPTLGNEFIALLKETSVVSFIAVIDVTRSLQSIADSTYEYFVPYIVLAITYLVIVLAITYFIRIMERRLSKNER